MNGMNNEDRSSLMNNDDAAAAAAADTVDDATNADTVPTTPKDLKIWNRKSEFSADSWWLVDLQATPSPRQGATPLVRRCMKAFQWDEAKARRVLPAYRQFLTIVKLNKDYNSETLLPSESVGLMWQQHMLDPINYVHDCMLHCGFVVGHNPDDNNFFMSTTTTTTVEEANYWKLRRAATREALLEFCSAKGGGADALDQSINGEWKEIFHEGIAGSSSAAAQQAGGASSAEIITIRIQDAVGAETVWKVKPQTKMARIYDTYATKHGFARDALKFFNGTTAIQDNETPQTLRLQDGCIMYCFRRI